MRVLVLIPVLLLLLLLKLVKWGTGPPRALTQAFICF